MITNQSGLEAVIAELTGKRDSFLAEAEKLTLAIEALSKLTSGTMPFQVVSKPITPDSLPVAVTREPTVGKYTNISVRWACLWMLSEASYGGLATSEIAARLVEGGKASQAYSFTSSVSAVLSMMRAKGEVEQIGNEWRITSTGRNAFAVIQPRIIAATN